MATVVRDSFSGRWRIDRRITDLRDGAEGRLTGWGVFEGTGKIVRYREEGKLFLRGEARERTDAFRIEFVAPGRVEVYFSDGEFFHSFDPRVDGPEAEHRHEGALYRVRYDFHRPWEWTMILHVTGPGKDIRTETRFRR